MGFSKKAVVLSSGGIDSTTTMAIAKSEGYMIYSLSFTYGQRHAVEVEAAKRIVTLSPTAFLMPCKAVTL